jgi:hypothetical protein
MQQQQQKQGMFAVGGRVAAACACSELCTEMWLARGSFHQQPQLQAEPAASTQRNRLLGARGCKTSTNLHVQLQLQQGMVQPQAVADVPVDLPA